MVAVQRVFCMLSIRSRVAARFATAALLLVIANVPAAQDSTPRQLHAEPSPLAQVIGGLAQGSPEARFDLAVLIVEALLDAYEAELDEALGDRGRESSTQRKLARWYQSTVPMLAEFRIAQAHLYAAREVELHADRHGQILLLIDGRPLWVAWPRVSVQSRIEREVAAAFCRRNDCPNDADGPGSRPLEAAGVQGAWVLFQGRPPGWETTNGLRCEFRDLSGRAARESLCRELALDMSAVAAILREVVRRGEPVDWAHLALQPDAASDRHRLVVTERGDYVTVAAPTLAGQPVDWAEVRRWLHARAQGRTGSATILRADGAWRY